MALGGRKEPFHDKDSESSSTNVTASVPWDSFLANSKVPQGQTDEIITWVTKLNQKRNALRSRAAAARKPRDLRKEAVIESAMRAASGELRTLQRSRMARWRSIRYSLEKPPQPSTNAMPQDTLCDCDACVLCRRHRGGEKCYCSTIFSPRPVFMDFTSSCVGAARLVAADPFAGLAVSKEIDQFLASLSPSSWSNSSTKRKFEEETWLLQKRCKA